MTDGSTRRGILLAGTSGAFGLFAWPAPILGARSVAPRERLARIPGVRPRNIIVILTDDHRHDAMGFMKAQSFGDTPMMDRLAREGVHFRNAFVTTALCSPSRASILTGLYAHQHRVVDNYHNIDPSLVFFPQHLREAGYDTAFIGKWHMGDAGDAPQPGFDHWVSFEGQGFYLPNPKGLNVDGKKVPQKGYITDELTDYAEAWLRKRPKDKPYLLYLSHKAVHAAFVPAERHKGRYRNETFVPPATQATTGPNAQGRPRWVQDQRNSFHGVDFPGESHRDIGESYKAYMETLLAVDESIGRLMALLEERGELDDTLILYLGDNGYQFGEHGLVDKRRPMRRRCGFRCSCGARRLSVAERGSIKWSRISTSRRACSPGPAVAAQAQRGTELSPAGARAVGAVAQRAALRILLGAQFPADANGSRAAWRPLQIHAVLRHLGH